MKSPEFRKWCYLSGMLKAITKTIFLLSLVSFFADISSEMLYPVMPLFLEKIGFGAMAIGLLEGMAGFLAGIGKAWFGSLSDLLNRRTIFIGGGYLLSAVAKPLIGLFPNLGVIFAARGLDRLGKGMRSGARDAVLVSESAPEDRGKVFGFHRAWDTLGAAIGPALALLWLHSHPGEYEVLFLIAFAPGMLGVLLTLGLKREPRSPWGEIRMARPFTGIFAFWREASPEYKRLLLGFLIFSLINSSDLFLLLRAAEIGMGPEQVIGAYILYNLVYAIASWPLGALGDLRGFKPVFLGSIFVFGLTYLGFGLGPSPSVLWVLFAVYGLFTAANEGISKSWISLHIPKEKKATGMGLFMFLNTLVVMVASPLMGLMWSLGSGEMVFLAVGGTALGLVLVLSVILPAEKVRT